MTLPVVFTANGPSGYNLTKSLRFRSSASAYLSRTPASAGNQRTWTLSFWMKRGSDIGSAYSNIFSARTGGSGTYTIAQFASDTIQFVDNGGMSLSTTQVFRDPSAWYHFVFAIDTTQATSSNRVKLYVNGIQITAFSTATYPSQNADLNVNSTATQLFAQNASSQYADYYLAEINHIDGQALTPSSFGQTDSATGVWQPAKYTGTYGTNGFYLPFTDTTSTTTISEDFSGNNNDWTSNNISLTAGSTYDSMTDVPTLTSATTANYAVMNPLRPFGGSLSNGNLTAVTGNSGSANSGFVTSTVWLPTSGKFYFEATPTTVSEIAIGLTTDSNIRAAMYYRNGDIYINGSVATSQASYTNNDVIGVAVDIGGATVQFYKNNAAQGTAQSISSITAPLVASLAQLSGSSSATAEVNFGQRPFAYTPPTGFVALNTFNLPTPTIGATASSQADDYFNVLTWTGDGTTSRSLTGLSFQPDFVWIKQRSTSISHTLYNSIVGGGANKSLASNNTDSESLTNANSVYGYLNTFDSNGFSVVRGSDGSISYTNVNSGTYVAWNWKANGSGSTNTAGSITSTVSANTTAGFSIVTYTGNATSGATVGHGLGVAPSMVIVKSRSAANNWCVYHISMGNQYATLLNTTAASYSNSNYWNNTSPTSTLFSLGNGNDTNQSSATFVAYCFAQVAGYSAFGSYTGNGSSDGPFIFTGFRPRFVLFKNANDANDWVIFDTARNTYNYLDAQLRPNTSDAEASGGSSNAADFLSNGFKVRSSFNWANRNGDTIIYAAFAENPFKYSLAR